MIDTAMACISLTNSIALKIKNMFHSWQDSGLRDGFARDGYQTTADDKKYATRMKLDNQEKRYRDGLLMVVSRDLKQCVPATEIFHAMHLTPTMQARPG